MLWGAGVGEILQRVTDVSDSSTAKPGKHALTLAAIALAWAFLAVLSRWGNSSTFDEPLHAAAAMAAVRGHLEVNPEHPPLWKYLAALPNAGEASTLDLSPATMDAIRHDPVAQWRWAVQQMYHAGKLPGESLVFRSGLALLPFGMGVVFLGGALVTAWAGPRAGKIAATLLAFDPLLLAHGPIVSNDVAIAFLLLSTLAVALKVRAGARWPWWLLLGALLAAAFGTKFTGLLAYPLAGGLVLLRRKPRVLPFAVALAVSYLGLWALYQFRYAPSPDGRLIDTAVTVQRIAGARATASGSSTLPDPDTATRFLVWLESTHALPQGLTAGLLMSYSVTRSNPSFAAGQFSLTGFGWYFPFALLVKTPLGLLLAWGIGIFAAARRLPVAWASRACVETSTDQPTPAEARGPCHWILLSAAFLLLASMASPLNIGVRHVLPVTVLLSLIAAPAIARVRHSVEWAVMFALWLGLLTCSQRYLSFFNLPAHLIGPEKLLSDSNLDWGQDLARLSEWRRVHPEGRLYLAYWGTPDPAAYGLDVTHLPNTYPYGTPPQQPTTERGYVAVSVTYLQPLPKIPPFYQRLLQRPPIAKIGDSIRVWDLPPPAPRSGN